MYHSDYTNVNIFPDFCSVSEYKKLNCCVVMCSVEKQNRRKHRSKTEENSCLTSRCFGHDQCSCNMQSFLLSVISTTKHKILLSIDFMSVCLWRPQNLQTKGKVTVMVLNSSLFLWVNQWCKQQDVFLWCVQVMFMWSLREKKFEGFKIINRTFI